MVKTENIFVQDRSMGCRIAVVLLRNNVDNQT